MYLTCWLGWVWLTQSSEEFSREVAESGALRLFSVVNQSAGDNEFLKLWIVRALATLASHSKFERRITLHQRKALIIVLIPESSKEYVQQPSTLAVIKQLQQDKSSAVRMWANQAVKCLAA